MRKELDDKLVTAFPNLYRNRHKSMMETCMCWGFDCDEGWFQIIWDLSEALEKEILKQPEDKRIYCSASQVKEKFGYLHFYIASGTDEMYRLINEAEQKSEVTCETCGAPGKTRGQGWYYTACEECEEKRETEREKRKISL